MPYEAKGKCVYKKVGCTKGSVKKYLTALRMNVNESDDLGWAEDLVSEVDSTLLYDKAWAILLPGPEKDFIEAQKWVFAQGFKWGGLGESELLGKNEYNYRAICTIGSIFHHNIDNKTLTYNGGSGCDRSYELNNNFRIAKNNSRREELYVFDWDSDKKEAILTEIVPLKPITESEEWFYNVINSDLMLTLEELQWGDVVIPTCNDKQEFIVIGTGHTPQLDGEPLNWVSFIGNGSPTGSMFLSNDTEIGKTCRFKLISRKNNIKESEEDEFDWVPNEVNLNDHRVLFTIIEDTLKNTNFKIVKDGKIYHIEDEYGDVYFYIPETDFNLPFIYHEIKDGIQFLTFEDDNEMLPYYQKLMGLLSPLYKNNIDKLFKPIKESEDDELGWAKDIVYNVENEIDLTTYKQELSIEEHQFRIKQQINIPLGSVLRISGYQDDFSFSKEEVVVVGENRAGTEKLVLFNRVVDLGNNDDYYYTHCGGANDDYKDICKCEPTEYGDDKGRCWYVRLEDQKEVTLLSNRKDIMSESKKPLLTEGRYDSITRKVVKDIMTVISQSSQEIGILTDTMLPNDLREGEEEYTQEGMAFAVEFNIQREVLTDNIYKDGFIVNSAAADDDYNILMITVYIDPKSEPQCYQKLFYKLQEDVRHEIEHFTQSGDYRIDDRPISRTKTANLKTVYGHHKHKVEVPALVHGFYRRAKLEKRPLDDIMMDDLDSEIERGNLSKKQAEQLLTMWIDYAKQHLPKAIYSNQ